MVSSCLVWLHVYYVAAAFNRSGTTQVVAHGIFKSFDKVCHADLLQKHESYGISV